MDVEEVGVDAHVDFGDSRVKLFLSVATRSVRGGQTSNNEQPKTTE